MDLHNWTGVYTLGKAGEYEVAQLLFFTNDPTQTHHLFLWDVTIWTKLHIVEVTSGIYFFLSELLTRIIDMN